MIFPAVIIGTRGRNFKEILVFALLVTCIASIAGLGSSIALERLSTVPSQVLFMLIFLMLTNLVMTKQKQVINE